MSSDTYAFPLSFAQQRLWFLDQMAGGNAFYNVPSALRLKVGLQAGVLERSLNEIVKRHEALRTRFVSVDGQPKQVIEAQVQLKLQVHDLRGLELARREAVAQELAAEEARKSFDLGSGPLIRAALVQLGPADSLFLVTMHHIVSDGWSMGVFFQELTALYGAFSSHGASPLSALPLQYADFAVWQRQWLQGPALEEQLAYWQRQLQGLSTLALPTDHPRPGVPTYRGARLTRPLPQRLVPALNALCQRTGATLFMTLLAAFQVLLHRYSGQDDIVVGVPIAGRTRPELEKLIGFFVNTLVLRADCSGDPRFIDLLQQVKEAALGAYAHQDVPFELLVERLHPDRDLSRNPLFQVGFALQNAAATATGGGGALNDDGQVLDVERGTSIFDLALHLWETPKGLAAHVEYSTELFEPGTVQRLLGHLETLLGAIADNPNQRLSQLPLLTEAERQQLLHEWNDTQAGYPDHATLHQLFEAQVKCSPQAPAVVSGEETLSYAELNRRANRIARRLIEHGVQADEPVGLCVHRSTAMVAALLGVLKAGGAYVPLDPEYPVQRLKYMLDDAKVRVLLASEDAPQLLGQGEGPGDALVLDGWEAEPGDETDPAPRAGPDHLAYIIYTSGSTGTPKGVMVPHRGLCNVFAAQQRLYRLAPQSRVLQFASLSFDASIFELVMAVGCGGTAFVPRRDEVLPGPDLAAYLRRHEIQIVTLPPSALAAVGADELPASLATINVAGEACPEELAARWSATRRFFNLYGPTETTIWATAALCSGAGKPSIGTPIDNVRVYVLDRQRQLVPIGVPGELCIGGPGVARGYVNRPEVTAASFIVDPFRREAHARLYRTGDLVRWQADGTLDYIGRLDHQVKLRGYRIELGDIESALREHPGVADAVATVRSDGPGGKRIVAYVTQDPDYASEDTQAEAGTLAHEQISDWQAIYDATYAQADGSTASAGPAVSQANAGALQDSLAALGDGLGVAQSGEASDFHGWNSSYTGSPIDELQMRSWLDETVERVLALRPERVLEIGCGSGLVLLRVAPQCTSYVGTDFSAAALGRLQQRVDAGGLSQVLLLHRTADNFDELPEGAFDLVVLNSVVQYFPGIDYLLQVFEGISRVLAPGGQVFVGDVRSLPLMEAFHASVELHGAPPATQREALARRVRNRMRQERELLLDPACFAALARRVPSLARAQARPKLGSYRNELSCFRFDVVLGGEPPPALVDPVRIDWTPEFATSVPPREQEDPGEAERVLDWKSRVRSRLQEVRPRCLLMMDVPDLRTERDVRLCALLADDKGAANAAEIAQALDHMELLGVDPLQMHPIADHLPYDVQLRCAASGLPGRFDVLYWRTDNGDAPVPAFCTEAGRPRLWRQYANNPLQGMVSQRLIPSLRSHLKQKLPDYMVPGAVVLLEQLPLGPNGKVDRQALPAPDGLRPELGVKYEAPRTAAESTLAEIWAQVLGLDQVGIHDNFFELGGDSILSIQIIARANRAGLKLTPPQLFQHQTVAELAAAAGTAGAVQAEQEAVTGELPLTPIQHWFFEQPRQRPQHFNQAVLLPLQHTDTARLQQALAALVRHHDALRLRYERHAQGWRQYHGPADEQPELQTADLSHLQGQAQAQALSEAAARTQASLDLQHGPLLRVQLFDLGAGQQRLLLAIHHLAIDGVSWRILMEDLASAYAQLSRGEAVQLPAKTTSFRQWAQRLAEYAASPAAQDELAYWQQQAQDLPPPLQADMRLDDDASGPQAVAASAAQQESETARCLIEPNTVASRREITTELDAPTTQALLQQVPAAYRTQINDALLAALLRSWQRHSGQSALWLDLEGHGREDLFDDIDLTRTVGWFTSLFPVRLECEPQAHCAQTLQAVKEQLRRIPRRGIGYGVLRYLNPDAQVRQALAQQRSPQISFNYLGQLGALDAQPQDIGPAHAPQDARRHLIEVNGSVEGGKLRMHWAYSERIHQRQTLQALADGFTEELHALVEHCSSPQAGGYTPSDFQKARVTQPELDRLIQRLRRSSEPREPGEARP